MQTTAVSEKPLQILIVDDHKMMRDGLRALLEKEGMVVAGEAADGYEALTLARQTLPSIVLMDITMPGLNGIDATRQLVEALPGIKVIALSMNSDRRYVVAMFQAGAVGYLLKNSASDELIQAIRAVARDHNYVSSAIASVVVEGLITPRAGAVAMAEPALSGREREVLQLVAEGMTSKDIAGQLKLSIPTVETHRRHIMDKLSLRSVAELTKYAIRTGLTSVD